MFARRRIPALKFAGSKTVARTASCRSGSTGNLTPRYVLLGRGSLWFASRYRTADIASSIKHSASLCVVGAAT
jgi:hypothetical protein